MVKRLIRKALKVVVGLTGALFLIDNGTFNQALLLIASLVVGFICVIILDNLDDDKTGYWPKPTSQWPDPPKPDASGTATAPPTLSPAPPATAP